MSGPPRAPDPELARELIPFIPTRLGEELEREGAVEVLAAWEEEECFFLEEEELEMVV